MPKSRVRVLVVYDDLRGIVVGGAPQVVCGHFNSQSCHWMIDGVGYGVKAKNVPYWQPLPAPPSD